MPDDYYVLQRSGEEIEELLDKAGSATGAVRYDAAQTLTDEQKAQARGNINAAPGGGGVMESVLEVSASSASESYDTFCAKLDAVLATMPAASVKFLRVYPPQYYGAGSDICALFKNSNDYAAVYTIGSYNKDRQGFRMIKYKRDSSDPAGQWDPLEYINPPMQLGVEYRTTERHLGKPVYVKVVSLGKLVTGHITYEVGDDEISSIISCTATVSSGPNSFNGRYTLPNIISNSLTDSWSTYVAFIDKAEIVVYCGGSMAGSEARAIIKYIKSTD